MSQPPVPLVNAAAAYAAAKWDEYDWRQFGRDTGTTDILNKHPRLYRALGFGDPDYADAAIEVMRDVLREAPEEGSGVRGQMQIVDEAMPDLHTWLMESAPPRTRRQFLDYVAKAEPWNLPAEWNNWDVAATASGTTEKSKTKSAATADEPLITRPQASGTIDVFHDGDAWRTSTKSENPVSGPFTAAAKSYGRENRSGPIVDIDGPLQMPQPRAKFPKDEDAPESIFIVHGHDETVLNAVRVFVQQETGIMPTSLAEEPGRGDTIIEKFERIGADAGYVIVLLTPDDVGQTVGDHDAKKAINRRARQNVVLELGYFIGKFGRPMVLVVDAGVERPSDLNGLSYVAYPGQWKHDLANELHEIFPRPRKS